MWILWGDVFAAVAVRPAGKGSSSSSSRKVFERLNSLTLEMHKCTSVLPYMSKHFLSNESLFPGGGKMWPRGDA